MVVLEFRSKSYSCLNLVVTSVSIYVVDCSMVGLKKLVQKSNFLPRFYTCHLIIKVLKMTRDDNSSIVKQACYVIKWRINL